MFPKPDWIGNSLETLELGLEDYENWLEAIVHATPDKDRRSRSARCLAAIRAARLVFTVDPDDFSQENVISLSAHVNKALFDYDLVVNERRSKSHKGKEEE